jgi:4-hydroxybenzoate polyprenyltransferase
VFFLAYQLIRTVRPRQWLKNLAVFAAPVLQGIIFEPAVLTTTIMAFISFCLLASATYITNDLVDLEHDKAHPIKKNRPIASGKLPVWLAFSFAVIFYAAGLFTAFDLVGRYFATAAVAYIVLQMAYSLYFRNVIILDALVVSTGFILRVFAGGLAADISISSWLILTTIGLSLLLAFGKRRSEKTILRDHNLSKNTRTTLRHYPDSLLDSIIAMSSSFCIMAYSLFTFQSSPLIRDETVTGLLPSILKSPKWMMLTIPLVIYGVARYLYIIYEKKEGESPERILLSDSPLLLTVILWAVSIFAIVYVLPR